MGAQDKVAAPAATAPVAGTAPDVARVRDTLVKPNKVRTHDIAGTLYTFEFGKHVEMPLEAARGIAHIPEFEVLAPNGVRIVVNRDQAVNATGGRAVLTLRSDQVIAELDELSDEAIARRARRAGFDPAGRSDAVAFLMKRAAQDAQAAAERSASRRQRLVNGKVVTVGDDDDEGVELEDEDDVEVGTVDPVALYAQQQAAKAAGGGRARA